MNLLSGISADAYPARLALVIGGVVVLGPGVAVSVIANVLLNSDEAFVSALSQVVHGNFGRIKVMFDVGCVVLAVILSFIFFDWQIVGTREGTVITGVVVNLFIRCLQSPLNSFFEMAHRA